MSADSPPRPLRLACRTLGCRLNRCDTAAIIDSLGSQGPLAIVRWEEAADLYLINSCTVTAQAAQECRRLVRQVKARRPEARVVVAGCYAQVQPARLAAMPEIDGVLGQRMQARAERWLAAVMAAGPRPVLVEPLDGGGPLDCAPTARPAGLSRAFVKVQDGCDLHCAYCQIRLARGRARSLPLAAVLARIGHLHEAAGFQEIVLTGVHLGAWGRDLAPAADLCEMLDALCEEVPGVRLRLSSLHPDEVTPELLSLLARRPRLRPHLHLSLQSGSESVLERMQRRYRGPQIDAAVAGLLAVDPLAGLGADLIVGFPGESDAEFADTYRLVERLPFSYLHVFRFSPRPGTPAAAMRPLTPQAIAQRAAKLRTLDRRKKSAFADRLLGTVREGVLERPDPRRNPWRRATLDNYAVVELASAEPAGSLVSVRITGQRNGRLQGEMVAMVRAGRA